MDDTICAISTALNNGAISIIRISGKDAIVNVSKIFLNKNFTKQKSHTFCYGKIISNNEVIDEVLVSLMLAPKTYTREDVVEINCHGSVSTTKKILELLIETGCRLAEPGEFTKRAFLNGRIDLVEAEAVQDLLESTGEKARKLAVSQLTGKLSSQIINCRQMLISLLANIELNIDYPEYEDAEIITNQNIIPKLSKIKIQLSKLFENSSNGIVIKEGIKVAIIGKPNVGKSSILNYLSESDKAIVTDIPGTTRDIIDADVILNGLKFQFFDTAGIRNTTDVIEKIGVSKSVATIDNCDLILFVVDNSKYITKEDIDIIEKIIDKKHIVFVNKIDLKSKLNIKKIKSTNIVFGNTITVGGLDELKNKIMELFNIGEIEAGDYTYLSNSRQISLIKQALESINDCLESANKKASIDILAEDIKDAWEKLGEIIGETYNDELLDELFSKFCLGK